MRSSGSDTSRKNIEMVQLVGRRINTPKVVGSSPAFETNELAQLVEHKTENLSVGGSIPLFITVCIISSIGRATFFQDVC